MFFALTETGTKSRCCWLKSTNKNPQIMRPPTFFSRVVVISSGSPSDYKGTIAGSCFHTLLKPNPFLGMTASSGRYFLLLGFFTNQTSRRWSSSSATAPPAAAAPAQAAAGCAWPRSSGEALRREWSDCGMKYKRRGVFLEGFNQLGGWRSKKGEEHVERICL